MSFPKMRRIGLAAGLAALCAATASAEPPKVGDTAKDFALKSIAGETVKLSDLTAKGPVVLVVLRGYPGYQCPICSRQVGEIAQNAKKIEAAGANVLMVYPGPADGLAERASEFLDGKGLPEPLTLVTDPDYTFTNLYDLRWDAPKETAYPSTFVIDGDGKIVSATISKTHGGRAGAKEILKALADAK